MLSRVKKEQRAQAKVGFIIRNEKAKYDGIWRVAVGSVSWEKGKRNYMKKCKKRI